jgi:hypothetical protein
MCVIVVVVVVVVVIMIGVESGFLIFFRFQFPMKKLILAQ